MVVNMGTVVYQMGWLVLRYLRCTVRGSRFDSVGFVQSVNG